MIKSRMPILSLFPQHGSSRRATRTPGTAAGRLVQSKELSRLLSAAVVNRRFRNLLLSDPAKALSVGYNGQKFDLDVAERSRVLSIQASSLESFAQQLVDAAPSQAESAGPVPSPRSSWTELPSITYSPGTQVSEAAAYVGKALDELTQARTNATTWEPELESTVRQAEAALQQAKEPLVRLLHAMALPGMDHPNLEYGGLQSGD